jgi:hypothetical protein
MGMLSPAHSEPLPLYEAGNQTTEATVIIDASPSQVYALVTDYDRWPALFSDVRSAHVERGSRDHARVGFYSKIIDHDLIVEFDNDPGKAIRFIGIEGPRGGRAKGTYVLEPIDGGKRTRVTATLYLAVVGLTKVFVSDSKLRTMRQAKLRADLNDVVARAPALATAAR